MTQGTSKLAILAVGIAAFAPVTGVAQTVETEQIIPLTSWDYQPLYEEGISTDTLLYESPVFGSNGEEIGDVENILFSADGRVLSVIAEVGGFWDIGDTHVNVPWSEIEMRSEDNGLIIPVTEATVDDYGSFPDELLTQATATMSTKPVGDDSSTHPRVWRATELIGDYARLWNESSYQNYGWVSDIIIRDGEIGAVMVRPAGNMRAPGAYGYPYYGRPYGWTPGAATYDMPYSPNDAGSVEAFDYNIYEQ